MKNEPAIPNSVVEFYYKDSKFDRKATVQKFSKLNVLQSRIYRVMDYVDHTSKKLNKQQPGRKQTLKDVDFLSRLSISIPEGLGFLRAALRRRLLCLDLRGRLRRWIELCVRSSAGSPGIQQDRWPRRILEWVPKRMSKMRLEGHGGRIHLDLEERLQVDLRFKKNKGKRIQRVQIFGVFIVVPRTIIAQTQNGVDCKVSIEILKSTLSMQIPLADKEEKQL
ncbi:hypothetical protein ILUMI_13381 [Ignelater luminosus]|uniref:Uncharacterized protein n=1 Tax=Ignelater luminosus TaxID=2038154 RepID=A0A8K0CSE3_IGNLU|nr:hypothetical protein ILUMI_13381 [Ignelater luminosus]